MNLADLLAKLSYGPLSELAMAGEGSGVVPAASIPKLIIAINDALVKLYTRFSLERKTLVLETVDGIYAYRLTQEYAQTSSSNQPNKYIKDSVVYPFTGDVLQVVGVMGNAAKLPTDPEYITQPRLPVSDYIDLPLNDRNDRLSWHTTAFDTLSMDYPKTGDRYFVLYRAKHAPIPLVPANAAAVDIRLPDVLESALLAYVAYRIYGGMSMEMAVSKSRIHLQVYESECAELENQNLFNQSEASTNMKPVLHGWR